MTTLKDKEQSDLTKLKWFWSEDVKEAVLKFEKYLYDDRSLKETCENRFKKIFGDFEK